MWSTLKYFHQRLTVSTEKVFLENWTHHCCFILWRRESTRLSYAMAVCIGFSGILRHWNLTSDAQPSHSLSLVPLLVPFPWLRRQTWQSAIMHQRALWKSSLVPVTYLFLSKLVICRGAYSSDKFCFLILHEVMGFSFLLQSQVLKKQSWLLCWLFCYIYLIISPWDHLIYLTALFVSYEPEISLKVSLNSTCVFVTRTLHG